MSYRVLQVI